MNHPSEFAVDKATDDIIYNLKNINIDDLCYMLVKFNKEKAEELFSGLKKQLNENYLTSSDNFLQINGQLLPEGRHQIYEFEGLENVVRGWAAMAGHRKDQENYASLSAEMK